MSLLTKWNDFVEQQQQNNDAQKFWNDYFLKEKAWYETILSRKTAIKGTVTELAAKASVDITIMTGFLDGINESLVKPIDMEALEEDTAITLNYDKEKLYYNMVAAKATWLYELPQWEKHLTEEKRKELYKSQKNSKTVVNENKVGRNEPCPCGSGKKYKKCCGA